MSIDDCFTQTDNYNVELDDEVANLAIYKGNKSGKEMLIENIYRKEDSKLRLMSQEIYDNGRDAFKSIKKIYDKQFEKQFYKRELV